MINFRIVLYEPLRKFESIEGGGLILYIFSKSTVIKLTRAYYPISLYSHVYLCSILKPQISGRKYSDNYREPHEPDL